MTPPEESRNTGNQIVFTGERFVPRQTDPLLALEHYHRYVFASRFASRKKVIDIGCGEGYGSAFLSRFAQSVTGTDVDVAAIQHARKKYEDYPNLTFETGACEEIAGREMYDMAVSFELLEHLTPENQARFLESVRRILKQDGLFILSSPEKSEYASACRQPNEYHKHEMNLPELKQFLGAWFTNVHLCAQRVLNASAMWSLEGSRKAEFKLHAGKDLLEEIPAGEHFAAPLYIVALCSNIPIPFETAVESSSFYIDVNNSDPGKDFVPWARRIDEEAARCRTINEELQERIKQRTEWAATLDSRIKEQNQVIETLQAELESRTRWARSLESDVAAEREHAEKERKYAEKEREYSEKVQDELRRIYSEMAGSYLYRVLSKLRIIPRVWGKKLS